MKQILFLVLMMGYFSLRSLVEPFWAVLMYYALAVLRPQYIWEWAIKSVTSKEIRWSLFAALIAFFVFLLNLTKLRSCRVGKGFMFLVVCFGLCLAGSYYYARDHEIAGKYAWEYGKLLVMFLLACFVITERWHVRYLAWMIFLCLMYLVYEINFGYIFLHRLDVYHLGYGGLDNNGAALMLAMVIPFCFYFYYAETRWWRWGFLVCLIPVLHAVMLTYSRGAMVSCLVVFAGMLTGMARRRFVQTAVVTIVLTVLVLVLAGEKVRERFVSIREDHPGSSRELRMASWKAGWNIARDYPLFGVGLRNSNLLTKAYGADVEGRTVHNVYIQIAADAGVTAGIIYTALISLALWCLHAGIRKTQSGLDDPQLRWHHYICRAAFWSMVLFAFGGLFLSVETFELCYLLMLLGAVAPSLANAESEETRAESEPLPVEKSPTRTLRKFRGAPVS